jgi:hypothetical protein
MKGPRSKECPPIRCRLKAPKFFYDSSETEASECYSQVPISAGMAFALELHQATFEDESNGSHAKESQGEIV